MNLQNLIAIQTQLSIDDLADCLEYMDVVESWTDALTPDPPK